MTQVRLKAIDLFCGAGGLSWGLRQAGFDVIAGVDIEPKFLQTFAHNFPHSFALQADLTVLSPTELMKQFGLHSGEVDMLVGGPPCQGFSKNVPRGHRRLDDPRNQLMGVFLDYCDILLPKFVLLENVAEMKNGFEQSFSKEIQERLELKGYTVTSCVLNAADYGVPQRRRRTFFIANRLGVLFQPPCPTHQAPTNSSSSKSTRVMQSTLFEQPSHLSVWDAISDLASLEHGEGNQVQAYARAPQTEYQTLMRLNAGEIVYNHIARHLQPMQFQRLAALEPGQGHSDLPPELQVASGYSGAYGRLTQQMIAPTLTRWVFHPGSGRWGHPVDIRTLTIREVARLQSFPDTYIFQGSYNEQAGQLGNAVPPLLAQTLIDTMLAQANEELSRRSDTSSNRVSRSNTVSGEGRVMFRTG